jgi:hypothetical protein
MSDLERKEDGLTSDDNKLTAKVRLEPEVTAAEPADKVLPLPGMIAIALYMLVLSAVLTFGVVTGRVSALLLILAPFFIAASFGLLRLFRWAWSLSLAAVFLLMSYDLWVFASEKRIASGVQGLLNLVFFFYLVRVDVRSRLR